MKRLVASLCLGLALFGAYVYAGPFRSGFVQRNYRTVKPVILRDSDGGLVDNFLWFYQGIKESGVPVVLDSFCVSACALILSLPKSQVCVMQGTTLGFHLVTEGIGGTPRPDLTEMMYRRYYPQVVLDWLATKTITSEITYMSYDEIIRLGVFDACE